MGKLGRNAPCHCGSGKKYKKCCLLKDEENTKAAPQAKAESEEDALFRDEAPSRPSAMEHDEPADDTGDEAGQDEWNAAEWSEIVDRRLKDPRDCLSEPSDEDKASLEIFFEQCFEIEDVDALRALLDRLIADRPDLVIHVLADFEPLHILGQMYTEAKRFDDYTDLILQLRHDFKDAYLLHYGTFDKDIVSILAGSGRYQEIENFLDLFQKYPSRSPENLFAVLELLFALNLWQPALALARNVYLELTLNPELINCEDIQFPVVMNCYASALDAVREGALLENAAEGVVNCLRGLRMPITPKWRKPERNLTHLRHILHEDRSWDLDGCETRSEVLQRYKAMLDHFMRFLHDKAHLHWLTANHYCRLIEIFFNALIPTGRIPRQNFPLTLENTRKAVSKSTVTFFSYNAPKLFGMLNGLHMLADFLVQTGSVSSDRGVELQEWICDISNEQYQKLKDTDLSARAFERFPLFRTDLAVNTRLEKDEERSMG